MNPYLFTLTFLMMMSLLTSSEAVRFSHQSLERHCYEDSRTLLAAAEELRDLSHLEHLRSERAKYSASQKEEEPIDDDEEKIITPNSSSKEVNKKAKALGIKAARPPNNSRLNLYNLLHKDPSSQLPKEFSLYEVTARLMRSLYRGEKFFDDYSGIEYRLLDKLMEKKEETRSFTSPDELSTLCFEDETLQEVFFQMLKGSKTAPSLLNFITFDPIESSGQSRKINFLFAHPLIIHAIFPEGDTAQQLLARREAIWAEIAYQEENRDKIPTSLYKGRQLFWADTKNALDEVLTSAGLKADKYKSQVFDCTLSQPGTILFIENPSTHMLSREKYTPRKSK